MTPIDALDRKILQTLQADGRISNSDLANKVGLSPSACLRRVQELERTGAIEGYRAIISPEARDIGFIAYVSVGLSKHNQQHQESFQIAMSKAPEVRECHNVTGAIEFLLRVETRDLAAFKHFHTDVLGVLPQVSTITSYIVMESSKDDRA